MIETIIRILLFVTLACYAVWFFNKWFREKQNAIVSLTRKRWKRLCKSEGFNGRSIANQRLDSRRLFKLGRAISIPIVVLLTAYLSNFVFKLPSPEPEQWGQMGDFFGGMLNPILAFASFIALLYTIRIQSEELRLTREEFKNSVDAQRDMAISQSSSVNIQLRTAELNRQITEFEHLSSMFQQRSKAANYLLYEFRQQIFFSSGGNYVSYEIERGLWRIYLSCLQKNPKQLTHLKKLFEDDVKKTTCEIRSGINTPLNAQPSINNLEILRQDAMLLGKIISKLESNDAFKESSDYLVLESKNVFLVVFVFFGVTEFSGYTFDPKPFLESEGVEYSESTES